MELKNYRAEFLFDPQQRIHYTIPFCIEKIKSLAFEYDIHYIWFFLEPHVELTWFCADDIDAGRFQNALKEWLMFQNITDYKFKGPENGDFADWWGRTKEENEFGGKVHSLCTEFVLLYYDYQYCVDHGRGLRKQVERTIHRLCNPVGISYWEEAKLCFSRGLICLLFCLFSFDRAVWIYRNIFRQDY